MPSAKCGGCARFLSPLGAARCSKCDAIYHKPCGGLPPSSSSNPNWICPDCKRNITSSRADSELAVYSAKQVNTSDINDSTTDSSTDLIVLLRQFKEELRLELRAIVKEEILDLRKEFQAEFLRLRQDMIQVQTDSNKVKESLKSCSQKIDDIEVRVNSLENKMPALLEGDIVSQLRQELNNRDQLLLANDIEISNLPETSGENLTHTAMLIATQLGVQIDERDIVSADRVGARHVDATSAAGPVVRRPRPVVVRLARRCLRDELLSGARVRRGATTADLGMTGPARRFFLNERLTTVNRHLFRRARDLGQRFGWKFVWTKRGRILARCKPGDQVLAIHSEADLSRVFGPDAEDSPM